MAIGDDIKPDLPGNSAAAAGATHLGVGTQTDPEEEAAFATRAWAQSTDERISGIEDRADVTDTRLAGIGDRVDDTNSRVGDLHERLSAVDERVSSVNRHVTDTNDRLGTVGEQVNGFDQRVTDMNGRFSGVDARLHRIAQRPDVERIDALSPERQAQIQGVALIRDAIPRNSADPQVQYVRSSLTSNIADMRNARSESDFVRAQDSAAGHVNQLQSRALATEAHKVGNKTAMWIGLAAIPGVLALIPSSIIAANNQTDRNKTIAGDNQG